MLDAVVGGMSSAGAVDASSDVLWETGKSGRWAIGDAVCERGKEMPLSRCLEVKQSSDKSRMRKTTAPNHLKSIRLSSQDPLFIMLIYRI